MLVCLSVFRKCNITWRSITSWDFRKILQMQSYLPETHSIGLDRGSQNWKGKLLIFVRKRPIWRKSWQNLLNRFRRHQILYKSRENSMRRNNCLSSEIPLSWTSWKNSNLTIKSNKWGISTKSKKDKLANAYIHTYLDLTNQIATSGKKKRTPINQKAKH